VNFSFAMPRSVARPKHSGKRPAGLGFRQREVEGAALFELVLLGAG
jgi:hypothetical protein